MVSEPGLEANFNVVRSGFSLEVSLHLPLQGVTAIFGHSGSGKTTLLRCIAGLEHSEGRLAVNNRVWQDQSTWVPPHRRLIGYVFQEANLFPHLSVRGNLGYALRRVLGKPRVSLEQVSRLLGLNPLLDRRPEWLSGGELQRVAMARAILTSPDLLLMDEPLASLDQASKNEILPFLDHLSGAVGIPILYVTHSLDEVMRLADHLVLLAQGRVLQSGPLGALVTRLDLPLAQDEEAESLFLGRVLGHQEEDHLTEVEFQGRRLLLTRRSVEPGQQVRIRIKAKNVSLILKEPQDSSILNYFPAQVEEISVPGLGGSSLAKVIVKLDLDGAPLLAHITKQSARRLNLQPGLALYAQVKSIGLM